MNSEARIALPPEEQARRREVVEQADWSCQMEGLGKPLPDRIVLDELWITGRIGRKDYEDRVIALAKGRVANCG
jgi:hypothetical protein